MCKLQVERKEKVINIKMLKRRIAQKDEEAQILCNQVIICKLNDNFIFIYFIG